VPKTGTRLQDVPRFMPQDSIIQEFTYPKRNRIRRRSDYLAMKTSQSLKARFGCFLVVVKSNGLFYNRLGVTVTKKIGNSVYRNFLKRRAREFFRLNQAKWPQGLDILFIARLGQLGTFKLGTLTEEAFLNKILEKALKFTEAEINK
jgi:ribonuclease P protein component